MLRMFTKVLLLMSLMIPSVIAQDTDGPAPPQVQAEMVIPVRKGDITENIHIIVDKSGSMDENQLRVAIGEAITISSQGLEDLNIAVTLFGADSARLTHRDPDSPIGPNWLRLPSEPNLERIQRFMGTGINGGGTALLAPLQRAIRENIGNHKGKPRILTIIIISDCEFDSMDRLRTEIPKILKGRPVRIGFVGIDAYVGENSRPVALARACKSWFVNLRIVEPEEEEEDD